VHATSAIVVEGTEVVYEAFLNLLYFLVHIIRAVHRFDGMKAVIPLEAGLVR